MKQERTNQNRYAVCIFEYCLYRNKYVRVNRTLFSFCPIEAREMEMTYVKINELKGNLYKNKYSRT